MSNSHKNTGSKKKPAKKTSQKKEVRTDGRGSLRSVMHRYRVRVSDFLSRRAHRSFRPTRRRDYTRSLKLPGFFAFTGMVFGTLWQHKKLFLLLALVYAVITAALVGFASQELYGYLNESLRSTGDEIFQGNWGEIGKATLLLGTGMLGALNSEPTDLQRLYTILLALFVWLTTVWLLRAIHAGHKPRLRDGLYNAGAPLVPTFLMSLVLVVQLVPVALAAIAFGAASASGFLTGGVESMLFWIVAGLLGLLSLYWMTTTFMALIVITLPGMYPVKAFRIAGDLVASRRIRILLRIVWLFAVNAVVWVVVMIPIILFDTWLKGVFPTIAWLPLVPIALLIIGSLSIVWTSAYTYLLYRKVVEDGASPA